MKRGTDQMHYSAKRNATRAGQAAAAACIATALLLAACGRPTAEGATEAGEQQTPAATTQAAATASAARPSGQTSSAVAVPAAGPVGMRSRALMTVALRVMGNLVTDADRDVVARAWRLAGRMSVKLDDRPPFAA